MPGRYALIVASGAYRDAKLSRLRTPTTDAEELARVLRDPEIGDFEVELAVDEEEAALRRRIAAFFSERSRDDLLLLHFSCHGLKDDSGHLYFAATDTEVDQLDATAVSAEFVSRQMTRSRSRKVIALLDCCYSGAIARGLTFRGGDRVDLDDHLGGNGRVILTASSAMEYAFEGGELTGEGNPSVFTTAVVKALDTGEADRDQDHRISVEELYDYVCEQVREVTPDQTPNMLSHLEGELFVARSSYVVPVPAAELSPELRAAIDSPLAGVRAGVVSELARLLTGHDRATAEAARAALTRLVGDDSRRVGAAASAALGAETASDGRGVAEEAPADRPVAERAPAKGRRFRRAAPAAAPARPASVPAAAASVPAAAASAPAAAASAPIRPAPSAPAASALVRSAPLALTVLGALLVLASQTVFADQPWEVQLRATHWAVALAVVAAAAIAALPRRPPILDALAPLLAGAPIGLAAAAGGLQGQSTIFFAHGGALVGGALLVAGVLLRPGRSAGRPSWPVIAVAVAGGIGLLITPGLTLWSDLTLGYLLQWPFETLAVAVPLLVFVCAAVGRRRGGRAWAVLLAAAGGAALCAAFALADFADVNEHETGAAIPVSLLSTLLIAAAGFSALLRPDPPPAQP